ncbi:MAG: PEP-CTERM sorting domain-containing protein [Leptolyngbya sp. SIO3F4]|nr:PEP-CTERM sorting domain-containing protein [Leptolyngbya sp. SIO3F4]
MIYRAFALGTLAALASVLHGHQALASNLDNDSLSISREITIGDITAKVTPGISLDSTGSSGAFSEFYGDNTVTIDFNSTATQIEENRYTFGSELITYTFEKTLDTTPLSQKTGVYNDRWAPAGINGEKNTSDYLAVFQGNSVTVDLHNDLNYFGINWGALSKGNDFTFLRDGTEISTFTYEDINPIAAVKAAHHNNEGNGYVHFYSNTDNSSFDQIKISQTSAGGFESDNHSFHLGNGPFNFDENFPNSQAVPEPISLMGIITIGVLMLRRKFY